MRVHQPPALPLSTFLQCLRGKPTRHGGTSMSNRPPGPSDLEARGRRFWRRQVKDFQFAAAELELLTEICRTLDLCETLEDIVRAEGATALGHKGQPTAHPAARELRQQRLALGRLLAQLDLPDEDDIPSPASIRVARPPSPDGKPSIDAGNSR